MPSNTGGSSASATVAPAARSKLAVEFEGVNCLRLSLGPVEGSAHSDPQPRDIVWWRWRTVTCQNSIQQRDIVNVASEQADTVNGGSQVPNAAAVEPGKAGLESKHAAEGSRQDRGPSGLRAERQRRHAIRDGRGRSAGRHAGAPAKVARIANSGGDGSGEFSRRALAEDDQACSAHEAHDARVCRGPMRLECLRAVSRRHVIGIKDVFDADGHAVQRPSPWFGVARTGLGQRVVAIDVRPGPQRRVAFGNSGKASLDDIDGCRLPARKPPRHLGGRERIQFPLLGEMRRHLQRF